MIYEEILKPPDTLTESSAPELLIEEQQQYEVECAIDRETDILDLLTPEQYRELMEAEKECDNGEVFSLDEFRKEFSTWRTEFKLENPHLKE